MTGYLIEDRFKDGQIVEKGEILFVIDPREFQATVDDAVRLRVRNDSGDMVPIGSVATVEDIAGPSRVPRYNLFPSAALIGDVAERFSTGEALATMERLADEMLPEGIGYEWIPNDIKDFKRRIT